MKREKCPARAELKDHLTHLKIEFKFRHKIGLLISKAFVFALATFSMTTLFSCSLFLWVPPAYAWSSIFTGALLTVFTFIGERTVVKYLRSGLQSQSIKIEEAREEIWMHDQCCGVNKKGKEQTLSEMFGRPKSSTDDNLRDAANALKNSFKRLNITALVYKLREQGVSAEDAVKFLGDMVISTPLDLKDIEILFNKFGAQPIYKNGGAVKAFAMAGDIDFVKNKLADVFRDNLKKEYPDDALFQERLTKLEDIFMTAFVSSENDRVEARHFLLNVIEKSSVDIDKLEEIMNYLEPKDFVMRSKYICKLSDGGLSAKAIVLSVGKNPSVKLKKPIKEIEKEAENESN